MLWPDWSENLGKGAVDWVHRGQAPSPSLLQPKAELDSIFLSVDFPNIFLWISQTYFFFGHIGPLISGDSPFLIFFFHQVNKYHQCPSGPDKGAERARGSGLFSLEEFLLGPKFGSNGPGNCRIAGHCWYESYLEYGSFLVCRTFWSMPRRSNELLTSLEDADVSQKCLHPDIAF